MVIDVIRLMVEALLVYALISWILAFVVLVAHRAATPDATLRGLAKEAVIVAVMHPLNLMHATYTLALRVIASFRK